MRLFVAVHVPDAVSEMLRTVARARDERVRWTTPEQWHVTLRFLGSVDDDAAVAKALDVIPALLRTGGVSSLTAALGPASAWFPGRRVLQVPVGGLDDLATAVADATAAWGTSPREAPFRGHLTLARARGDERGPASLAGVPLSAQWEVEKVALMSSDLGRGGARYTTEAEVPLFGDPRSS